MWNEAGRRKFAQPALLRLLVVEANAVEDGSFLDLARR